MRGVNKAILVGVLGKDPETRFTPNGLAITTVSVATSEQWKDKTTGKKQEKTEWHNVKFFGKLAEIAGEYLKKGGQVYIEGRIQTEKYEKDGITRYATKIVADKMEMLGSKPGGSGERQERGPARGPQATPTARQDDFDDDEIPF